MDPIKEESTDSDDTGHARLRHWALACLDLPDAQIRFLVAVLLFTGEHT